MKILVDGTNPENEHGKLCFQIIEVPIETPVELQWELGSIQYVWIEGVFDDEFKVLMDFTVNFVPMSHEEILKQCDPAIKDWYKDKEDKVDPDDYQTIEINMILAKVLAVTGCEAVVYLYS